MTQITACKNTMCDFNYDGHCGCDEVSLDVTGSCIDCIIDSIYTDTEDDTDGKDTD